MNENNNKKKGFSIKIAGFNFGKKQLIMLGILIIIIIIIISASKRKEMEQSQAVLDELGISNNTGTNVETPPTSDTNVNSSGLTDAELAYLMRINYYSGTGEFSDEAREQLSFYRQKGDPGEGYIWNDEYGRIAISDASLTPQEVVEAYIQNIRFLNFAEANKYSTSQATTKAYQTLYEDTAGELDIFTSYQRKLYKLIYENIELKEVSVGAVFEDGTQHITVTLNSIDLQDKTFITGDVKIKLFEQLWEITRTTGDSNQNKEIILDFLYDYYSENLPKRSFDITFVVTKSASGWVISEDRALTNILTNSDGVEASSYILELYDEDAEDLFGED